MEKGRGLGMKRDLYIVSNKELEMRLRGFPSFRFKYCGVHVLMPEEQLERDTMPL